MHGERGLELSRFLRRLIRAGIAWLGPTFLGENAVRSRLNYVMHSIDDLRDAVKGWLHSRRWVTRKKLGDDARAPGVGDTGLSMAEISSRGKCVGCARQWEKGLAWQG